MASTASGSTTSRNLRGFFGWIDEKNGSYPESVAEGLYANMPDWMRERYDTMEVLDAVLSVVGSNPRPRDMVVDYVKRLREQNRDMDEYYADEAAGARGFHDAGEMDAYDNMREREAAGFHDVAAAGREADGARADLLADAQARLNDPNASEYEKQAARTVLRFRQRDGRDGVAPQETEGDDSQPLFRLRGEEKKHVERNNKRFNEELDRQIAGQLPQGHIYNLGRAGSILQSAGFPDADIELSATKLAEKARQHGFGIDDVRNLVSALQEPVAVFSYGDKAKAQNVIAEIVRDGKNFVVGVHFNQVRGNTEVSSIRGLFPKDNAEWLNWVSQGKLLYVDKEKIQTLIDQQRTNPADVDYLDLEDVAKIIKDFENPSVLSENNSKTTESGGISQGFGSAATSLNQVASAMRKIDWKPGTVNVDIGGGRFDKATEYLREQGVESMVFDPFNRDAEHNRQVAERVRDEKVDTVTCNNVLNVIDSASSRANVILQAAKALKPGGTAYFSVYEGDKSGVGRQTKSDSWQNNRVTKDYVSEIERYFDDVTVKDKVIIAKNPKATTEQSVWDFDGKYSGNDVRFRHRAPNGKESRLDERQYDEVRTGNFKRWFGDWENDPESASKVVDENGEPLVVYHQTNSKQYINRETGQNWDDLDWREREEWDRRSDEEWNDAWEEQDFYTFDNRNARQSVEYPGFFFSPRYDEHHEYGDRTIAAYLDMKSPAIDPDIPNAGVTDTAGRDAMESLMRQGYDGVIRTEDGVPYEYIVFRPEQIKSATENNGDFSRESGDIRFRFVGERGAGRQDMADGGERMRNKEIAEAMERGGKDARAIKLATGWERGKDGKWRHEERDLRLNDEQFMKFVQHDGSAIYWGKLGDLVGDNELFDAYPQLKELTIYSNTDNDNQYDPKHNEIGLATNVVWSDAMQRDYNKLAELRESLEYNLSRAEAVKDRHPHAAENYRIWASDDQHAIAAIQENIDWMRDVLNAALVHEVQHAIQEIEGFARGGSPRDFGGTPDEMVVGQAIADRMAADRVIEDGDTIDTLREKFNERKDKEDFDTKNERRVIADAIGIMSEGYTPKDVRDLYAKEEKRLWDMYHDDSPESAYGKYNRLAGEVEARNVSKRMKMTDEQRRQSLAEDTEDVARDEQIVRFGNGVSAMGSRVDKRMAEIGRLLEGRDMTDEQRKVADVFSGKSDKSILEIEKDGSVITIELMQGGENKAGSKHAVFRHYDTREGYFTSDDILVIPEIVKNGERTIDGRKASYTLDKDGVKYTFATERKGSSERMVTFYTDRKAPAMSSQNTSKDARTDTADALIGGKGSENSADGQMDGGETTNFRVRGGVSGEPADHTTAVEEARRRLESGDASEFERQAARAVIKAYGGGSDDAPDTTGGGVRFRIRDDADMLVDMAKHNNEVARQRRDAVTDFVKAITDVDELTDSKFATALGKVMRGQRQYDQETVADITTMVKAMMDAGLLTELDNFSVKQILTKVKDSTGKNDITAEANKLIDIMLKHQLRRGKRAFEQQLKVKGMRQDSRGVAHLPRTPRTWRVTSRLCAPVTG